ncbi:MAG TPA: exo-beta-N-acetylmuramidase NamZ domain-containing protein, partial [Abditibacteriaceae bacterium]
MNSVLPGVDVLYQEQSPELLHFLRQRRCGLVTNHTGRTRDGKSTLEVLEELEVSVGALFFPEHGPRGVLEGNLESTTEFGRTHHSLYGETRRPTSQMLQGIDALVFDIQDVGARFYTYSSTLALCLEACAEHGVAVVVLDRPNPLGGEVIEGPLVDEDVRSFVGH